MKGGAALASIQLGKTPIETLKNIPVNIREIRPHFLLSVPSLAKSFRKNIEKGIREKGPKVEALFRKALKLAYDYNGDGWDRGKGLKALKKPFMVLADKLVFRKVREAFGGRLEFFVGGGALLDIELQRFFYAIGMPMLQGYGLTEAAPVISANSLAVHKLGSSGRVADRDRAQDPATIPAGTFPPAGRARSSSAARTSWPATGRTSGRRARLSGTAGCIRAISATSTPTASFSSWAG